MLLSKQQLAVRVAASKDETRYNLCGVRIEPDGTCLATDGTMLLIARVPVPSTEEAPTQMHAGGELSEPILVPAAALDRVVKKIPKSRSSYLPILQHVALDVEHTEANGVARFITTDLETTEVTDVRKIEGEFPDVSKVMPKGKPKATFCVDLALIERVAKAVRQFTDAPHLGVKFEVFEDEPDTKLTTKPIRITCKQGEGGELTAIVMLIRL